VRTPTNVNIQNQLGVANNIIIMLYNLPLWLKFLDSGGKHTAYAFLPYCRNLYNL